MADTGRGDVLRSRVVCDDRCGCTIPCAGGSTCRCRSSEAARGGSGHTTCSCGEHCGCNPCECADNVAAGTACKCAPGCTCASCRI
ncbi:metallothionein-like protein 4A [Gastrolobium bilobum]|uniref:metallothionein-like protein 4A n=1 Tax=Gastrolobium bilobum TaxID=150636 RepID=UPI002AB2DA69|nr:metallothionein-like protein 4A [Gastrolobium bilobum]